MARLISRLSGSAAIAATLSMAAAPVAAAELPQAPARSVSQPGEAAWSGRVSEDVANGWGRHRRHRGGVDAGDVIAGVLILGGIAAVASAASKSSRQRDDYRYREPYRDERPEYRPERSSSSASGIDNAVDMCVGQVERGDDRVASVDNASRTGEGWRISGQLDAGGGFSCWIDNDGRIRNVDLDSGYYSSSYEGGEAASQYDDETYARARAQVREQDPYPEGDYSEIDGDLGG